MKLSQQSGFVWAPVRRLLWLAVFAAAFCNGFDSAIVPPCDKCIPPGVCTVPGLIGMELLFAQAAVHPLLALVCRAPMLGALALRSAGRFRGLAS